MITLKTFNSSIEAHILKSKLESEGIQCVLYDENTMDMNPLYNYTIGGVKLKIDEKDLAQANIILAEIEDKPFVNDQDQIIHCPKCNSQELGNGIKVVEGFRGYLSVFLMIAFAIFPFFKSTSFYCKQCGNVFKK